jgi:arsenate reductase-like glutaredoxin family protein
VEVARQQDAKKQTIPGRRALDVLEGIDEVYATKGKKVVHVDLRRERPDDETLRSLLVGPSGNLRAPTLRRGRTLLVGFDEATYRKVLG